VGTDGWEAPKYGLGALIYKTTRQQQYIVAVQEATHLPHLIREVTPRVDIYFTNLKKGNDMKRNKPNTNTPPTADGYGSPTYLRWEEENDEYLAQQLDEDNPANIAALEIMRTIFGGKHEKHRNKK
jgi:hypothetical protein